MHFEQGYGGEKTIPEAHELFVYGHTRQADIFLKNPDKFSLDLPCFFSFSPMRSLMLYKIWLSRRYQIRIMHESDT